MPRPNLNLLEQQRRADLAALLEPSYQPHSYSPSQPSTSNSLRFLYTDALGNLHDPDYKVFPTDEWKQLEARRSFDDKRDKFIDDDDCTDDDEDDNSIADTWDDPEYAFGGRKSRANPHHHHHHHHSSSHHSHSPTSHLHPVNAYGTLPRKSNFASQHAILPPHSGIAVPHNSPSSSPYIAPLSFPSSSPRRASMDEPHSASSSSSPFAGSLFHAATEPSSPRSSSPASKRRPARLLRRKPQHEIYDEDAQWEDDDDEPAIVAETQIEKPSFSHPIQLDEKTVHIGDTTPTCKVFFTSIGEKTRRQWQYVQLSVQLTIFRTNRKWRRRFSF